MNSPHIFHGDCLDVMREMEENSIDAVVCDPPYELTSITKRFGKNGAAQKYGKDGRFARLAKGFIGKEWDGTGIGMNPEVWTACARVAKPGAYLLAFGGTRTFHRLACAIEDAGWIMRDSMVWLYGSGFPKSHDISKAIDRKAGAEREVIGENPNYRKSQAEYHWAGGDTPTRQIISKDITAPATPEAKQWNGFGTALKPAWEPVLLFQKPVEGTYAENVLKWGCGALNIDGCRIGTSKNVPASPSDTGHFGSTKMALWNRSGMDPHQGRWPANFLLSHTIFCEKVGEREAAGYAINRFTDGAKPFGGGAGHPYESEKQGGQMVDVYRCVPDCPVRMLDEQSGETVTRPHDGDGKPLDTQGTGWRFRRMPSTLSDRGGASRFFYCAKASRQERNAGLEEVNSLFEKRPGFQEKGKAWNGYSEENSSEFERGSLTLEDRFTALPQANVHPTVKPIELLRYLCRLVTPPGGMVLDPFVGSGSTGCAAVLEGFQFFGIDKEREYTKIAEARIQHWAAMASNVKEKI